MLFIKGFDKSKALSGQYQSTLNLYWSETGTVTMVLNISCKLTNIASGQNWVCVPPWQKMSSPKPVFSINKTLVVPALRKRNFEVTVDDKLWFAANTAAVAH